MKKMRESQRLFVFGRRHLVMFAVLIAFFGAVQWSSTFKDPDSFYHLGLAERLARGELVRDFTWLPLTTLADAYADHHLLYHLLLVPFVAFSDPFVGAKVATTLFAALAIIAFMRVIERQGVRHAWAYALMLATSASFMFRLNLTKASAPALILFLLAVHFAWARKPFALAAVSFLHVWMHGSWPALIGVAIAAITADALAHRASGTRMKAAFRAADQKPLYGVLAGIVAGLVINPYFPANLAFYKEQILRIAVMGPVPSVAVGAEWYGYAPSALFAESSIAFLLFLGGIALLAAGMLSDGVMKMRPLDEGRVRFLALSGMLTLVFLVLALRSRRHIEYFVPFFMLFDAVFLDALLRRTDAKAFLRAMGRTFGMRHAGAVLIMAAFAVVALLAARSIIEVTTLQHRGIDRHAMSAATQWLGERTEDGEVVLHTGWDAFPMLWYHGPHNAYIVGLDPMFLYAADADAYSAWASLMKGEGDVSEALTRFGARFLLVEKRSGTEELTGKAERDPALERVYEDEDVRIYSGI